MIGRFGAPAPAGALTLLQDPGAGIYGPMGTIDEIDWDAWVQAINVNLLGSVLMCRSLTPHFKRRGYGKIVQLAGGGATAPMPGISAYAASKAAVVRFAETLAGELGPASTSPLSHLAR